MVAEDKLLSKAKEQIESKLGWGDSRDWTNQDFLALSRRIQEELRVPVSHVTLKRIWGRVRYESLPNTFTLSTLAQFIGYENWRDFKVKNGAGANHGSEAHDLQIERVGGGSKAFRLLLISATVLLLATGIVWVIAARESPVREEEYTFSARKTIARGVPNSVIFEYDAARAPVDAVSIQQSWDLKRRTTVSRDGHQRTLIYYFPGYFEAKLVVADQIVKEQGLLIETDGWLAAIDASPMPVYFRKTDFIKQGMMTLSVDALQSQHIALAPQAPTLSFVNVADFGEIYSDEFVFEAALRNDYRDGSSVCQNTNIYLLCEGSAIGIPLCTLGCVSNALFYFTQFSAPGKQFDLSAFGVDFDNFVHVKVESSNGKGRVWVNGKLAYVADRDIIKSKIIGIDFVFQGTGSVDFVRLSNQSVKFEDTF